MNKVGNKKERIENERVCLLSAFGENLLDLNDRSVDAVT